MHMMQSVVNSYDNTDILLFSYPCHAYLLKQESTFNVLHADFPDVKEAEYLEEELPLLTAFVYTVNLVPVTQDIMKS